MTNTTRDEQTVFSVEGIIEGGFVIYPHATQADETETRAREMFAASLHNFAVLNTRIQPRPYRFTAEIRKTRDQKISEQDGSVYQFRGQINTHGVALIDFSTTLAGYTQENVRPEIEGELRDLAQYFSNHIFDLRIYHAQRQPTTAHSGFDDTA